MFTNYKLIVGVVSLVVLVGLMAFYTPGPLPESMQAPTSTTPTGTVKTGDQSVYKPSYSGAVSKETSIVAFAIRDKAATLEGLQSVNMIVREISLLVPKKGWVPVVSKQTSFDLLQMKREGGLNFLSELNLEKGTYNQIRILIDGMVISQNNIPKAAKLPSGEMKIITNLIVEEGRDSAVILDFDLSKSLHLTGNNQYIFTPVVHVSTLRGVQIQKLGKKVDLIGGVGDFSGDAGMDENGQTQPNAFIDLTSRLEIVKDRIAIIPLSINMTDVKISAEQAMDEALNAKYLNSITSARVEMREGKAVWRVLGMQGGAALRVYVDAATGEIISIEA